MRFPDHTIKFYVWLKHVEDVEDRSNTHKGCNAMYVEDVEDIKTSHNRCILKYVEDVKDRSNTHKGCNAMYVEDVCVCIIIFMIFLDGNNVTSTSYTPIDHVQCQISNQGLHDRNLFFQVFFWSRDLKCR